MKKSIGIIVILFTIAGSYHYLTRTIEPPFELEPHYQYLYDGNSLKGWQLIGGQATFIAQGESIVGHNGPGENTFLRTETTYRDFSLKMQVRWDKPGNSGVQFRSRQRESDGRTVGYQFELDPSDRAWSGGIYDEARRNWLDNPENNPASRNAIRLEGWNDIEIEARGARLKTWLNGVPVSDIIDGLTLEGFIALQVHSGNEGELRWRRIRIREYPNSLTPAETLLNPMEWRHRDNVKLAFTDTGLSASGPEKGFWMIPRRQFKDAMITMTVPACELPTIVQMRYRQEEGDDSASFAEVKIYSDHAQARLVTLDEEQLFEPVELEPATQQRFIGLTQNDAVVLTVGEKDALRLGNTSLHERGELRISPARCSASTSIDNFEWYSLVAKPSQPLFYETLDTPPSPTLTPDESLQAFRIAPGFSIELVAAEPLIEDPVAMSWDEYGRLYVVEMRGYMPDAYGTGSNKPVGQVVRLEDTDGDGAMDTSEVFMGGLVNPRAVAVVNQGILIGEPPTLWLCEVSRRESLCENKRAVADYAANLKNANVEHMENGLLQGLDNWLYNAKSNRSLKFVNDKIIAKEDLHRGQWGITKDRYGRLLYNHNSTWIQADFFAAQGLVKSGDTANYNGLGVNLTDPAEVYSIRVNPGVNRAYLDGTLREDGRLRGATGASGILAYRGDQFPPRYSGDVFVPESAGNVVAQFAMEADGMTLTAEQRLYKDDHWGERDFLASTDERFRPVNAMNGPDGSLYIVDMYRGIIQDNHFLTDELREQIFQRGLDRPLGLGRIWRVRHDEGKVSRKLPNIAGADAEQLVNLLRHANGWVRDTAQRLLIARSGEGGAALIELARNGETIPALHAIWALAGRGELTRELVISLAAENSTHRQIQALRAGHALLLADDLLRLSAQLEDAPESVVMQLMFALANHSGKPAVRNKLTQLLAAHIESPYLRQAAIRAVAGHELTFVGEYLAANTSANASTAAFLQALSGASYRSVRGDLSSDEPVSDPRLLQLLSLIESRKGEAAWQQIAMLAGLESVVTDAKFVPAHLASPPPIFSDGTVSEQDPLWDARLRSRAAFTWPGDELAMGIKPLSPEQLQLQALGEAFYPQCGACHGASGMGTAGLAPPLANASWVIGPPEWLARIILQGMNGPLNVAGQSWNAVMPPHGHLADLDNDTLAGLMTYLRRSWGNKASPVSADAVAAIRQASAARDRPWTAQELKEVAFDRGFKRYAGEYEISFVTLTITDKPEGLHLSVPMYGGGLLRQVSGAEFEGEAGGERVKLKFIIDPGGAVNAMRVHYGSDTLTVKRK